MKRFYVVKPTLYGIPLGWISRNKFFIETHQAYARMINAAWRRQIYPNVHGPMLIFMHIKWKLRVKTKFLWNGLRLEIRICNVIGFRPNHFNHDNSYWRYGKYNYPQGVEYMNASSNWKTVYKLIKDKKLCRLVVTTFRKEFFTCV